MKIIAIIVGKLTIFAGKILHRGSSLPGKLALKIDKNILSKLKYPETRIIVTGSSGKGSTSKLIAEVMKRNGKTVCFNEAGSNLAWGITTSLLKHSNLRGKIKTEYLVLEIDERYAKHILNDILPTHIIITNITKDQPPRQHHIDVIYDEILTSINDNATIITNMDDPYLRNFAKDKENMNLYYSIAQNKYSYKKQIFENLNIYNCPYCKEGLKYNYYNFETLGNYYCPSCEFKYEKPDIIGEELNLEKEEIKISEEKIFIGGSMLYNAYNTLSAYTVLKAIGFNNKNIIKSINELNKPKKRYFENNSKKYYAMSCKAENATTYNQAIFKTINMREKKDIIIGWKEISRRYKHYDISWLYDIEFELLNNDTINKIYACGIDAENIKKRLILAGIKENKIITSDNIELIKDEIKSNKSKLVIGILNFDYVMPFLKAFMEEIK